MLSIAAIARPKTAVRRSTPGLPPIPSIPSHRMPAEEKLKEREAYLHTLLESNPASIILVEKETKRIRYVNDRARRAIGLPVGEILGKVCHRFICPAESHSCPVCDLGQTIDQSEKILLQQDGSALPILKTVAVITVDGREYLLESFLDISESKRADEEKRVLQERLQRAEKMEALGTLAGGVAHDLNNVLGVIIGYSELLLAEMPESGNMKSIMEKVVQGGERAAAIVQDLLTMARRNVRVEKIINLNEIVAETKTSPEFLKIASRHPLVRMEVELSEDLLNITGSPVHLSKALFNLVNNALEAIPKNTAGTITITTSNQYMDKPVQGYDHIEEGDYAVLSVSDTGEGIAASDLKHIFEPFYTKKEMGRSGTGLGLAIVWGTLKDHHGYINVVSEKDRGTTLTLYFPVTRKELSCADVPAVLSSYLGNEERALVVDDIPEQRDLVCAMLKKLNYQVASVPSGEAAVEYMRRQSADILILDMIMPPGMDGLDTYRKILETHPTQKAIIVSGSDETDRVRQVQGLGAGAYVKKPYLLEKLGMAVRRELDA